MIAQDTIAALGSAAGAAARMVVRISGRKAVPFASAIWNGSLPDAGGAGRGSLRLRGLHAPAWLYLFRAPHSYSGEDLIEFHLAGNPTLAGWLLEDLLRGGARAADPGEFTARAYFNGKLDLAAAEGVAATISANSEQELAAARRLLAGELTRRLAPVIDLAAQTLALLEVGIDFSDEDVSFLSRGEFSGRIEKCDALLRQILDESVRFERMAHEPRVVLAGRPNAGKSTLLNALAGYERAVVSPTAGTTRDVLWVHVALDHGVIRLADAAGLEEEIAAPEPQPVDPKRRIEAQMRNHARRALEEAEHVAYVHDATDTRPVLSLTRDPGLMIRSKMDLVEDAACQPPAFQPAPSDRRAMADGARHAESVAPSSQGGAGSGEWICASALRGEGLAELRAALDRLCFGEASAAPALGLNARHVRAIEEGRRALARAADATDAGPEILALELREAIDALGSISGRISPDDLLGRIFSAFCIGK